MQIPVIQGTIDRRILVNFQVDPVVMARNLPAPFRPKLANGSAIGGICFIRLKSLRPRLIPFPFGLESENAAHRIAVEWDVDGQPQQGVYIPRRDTNSRLTTWAGGTVFPGTHHHAAFSVRENGDLFSIAVQSDDGDVRMTVSGKVTDRLPSSSGFTSVAEASAFFEQGSLGYSATTTHGRYDGLELRCKDWHVEPLETDLIESSYFENETHFPQGSVKFDCALLMRNIKHEWHGRSDLCCDAPNMESNSVQ